MQRKKTFKNSPVKKNNATEMHFSCFDFVELNKIETFFQERLLCLHENKPCSETCSKIVLKQGEAYFKPGAFT